MEIRSLNKDKGNNWIEGEGKEGKARVSANEAPKLKNPKLFKNF